MSTKSSVLTNTVSSFKFQRSLKSVGVKLFLVLLISLLISIPISTFLNGLISGLIDDLPVIVAFVLNTIVSLAVTSFLIMLAVRLLILNPLYEAVRTMKKVANGDLRTKLEIHTKDEFGQLAAAFNRMTDNLRALIEDVRTNSDQVVDTSKQFIDQVQLTTASSKEINTMLREVATGTDTQLSGAEQTAQIMDEMTTGIHRIAESASVVAEMSNKATEEVDSGKTFIIKVREQMDAIDSVTDNVADEIQQLSSQSKEINQIVNVITEIANQTNLLALNAAIEAARAGEHGKGFAVVAKEVQKLAEQSERSASQISELVKRIQTHTQQTVSVMNNGKKEVANGTHVIGDAEQSFEKIATLIEEVAGQIQDVSASVEEISASSEQVHSSTSETARIARESAERTQQVSVTTDQQLETMVEVNNQADSLTRTAQALLKSIQSFKLK
ncbi:methyl-accepting chemotaxis protein [Pseudalkalibacillus salsuginis]|uniref:methyl-accepting chemotaxis protein n=1 Tax=Pseudalkalibacillus salsuginis TaxID=2910972 RepID=UPI001F2D15E7|nr:HAMP domain-containing methyl-accepting chemotaxis protein [Pseudalkalibacillus salsuginis]MCF6411776.1 methyl-accepting chemotaxis protein [Pseudalkalibacillus salsuginis]